MISHLFKPKIGVKEIPLNGCPCRWFTFSIEGWKAREVSLLDNEFIEAISCSACIIQSFYEKYRDFFAFADAIFSVSKEGIASVRIGVMELEKYKFIYEKEKVSDDNTTRNP